MSVLYDDDTRLMCSYKNSVMTKSILKHSVKKTETWNCININDSTIEYILLSLGNSIAYYGEIKHVRLLGLYLDNELSWQPGKKLS